ncbi:MAG: gamma-glutamyl-gamma-aminobutyrate hydrolase family protein [Deltaproteobacteria bacterium]|nr:gamma-glutamyl-gamma-aminobutyrate hydrolase family protein [Deltaproteobacteria bacterium]
MEELILCVPNFSEGRDLSVIDAITARIESVDGVELLDVDPGQATNRTVVTFVGPPDAVFLSNGPGDPAAVEGVLDNVRSLANELPLFGICLGHQILGLALGGTTHKLKFGHHGGNQPGQDQFTKKVSICAENHGFAVDAESLRAAGEPVVITHLNLNDGTVEGLAHETKPIFSVQYHPEASPGPHDAGFFFTRFREMVLRHKQGEAVTGAQIANTADNAADCSAEKGA